MLGEIAALVTAVCWAFTSIIFTEASRRVGSLNVNIIRLSFASAYLLLTILIAGLDWQLVSEQYLFLALSGIVGLVIGDSFLYLSYKHSGPRIGMLMMSLAPPITVITAFVFLGEKISVTGILGIVITVTGVVLVVLQKEELPAAKYKINKIGILFGLFAAIGQAIGLILSKAAFNAGELNSFIANFFRIASAMFFLVPFGLMLRKREDGNQSVGKNKKIIFLIGGGAFLGPFMGITLSLYSISVTATGVATAIMATVPVILLPMVRIYYKEKLSLLSVIGAVLAVAGVCVLFLR